MLLYYDIIHISNKKERSLIIILCDPEMIQVVILNIQKLLKIVIKYELQIFTGTNFQNIFVLGRHL